VWPRPPSFRCPGRTARGGTAIPAVSTLIRAVVSIRVSKIHYDGASDCDRMRAKYIHVARYRRSPGLTVTDASAAIDSRRIPCCGQPWWSANASLPPRPELCWRSSCRAAFWSTVASDLAMSIAESDRASCCPAGSMGVCCDKSGLCQRGSKAEATGLPPNSL